MRKILFMSILGFMIAFGYAYQVEACHKNHKKCEDCYNDSDCDDDKDDCKKNKWKCNKWKKECKCKCGIECTWEKKCKFIKYWKKEEVCGPEDKKCYCGNVAVCHIPPGNPGNMHTICISQSAVQAHLDHGDYLGVCTKCEMKWVNKYKKCCKNIKVCKCKKCPLPPPLACPETGPCGKPDAGVSEKDVGVPEKDVGVPEKDVGVPEKDVGVPEKDVGVPEKDVGVPEKDVSVPEKDVSVPEKDIGIPGDTEVIEVDGNCPDCPPGYKEEELEMVGGGCDCNTSGGSTGTGLGVLLVIAFIGLLSYRKKISGLLAVLAICLMSTTSYATPNLPSSNFKPGMSPDDYYITLNGKTLPHKEFSFGFMYNYTHRPLQIVFEKSGERLTDVIRHRHNLDLLFSVGGFGFLEFGAALPFILSQSTDGLYYLGEDHNRAFDGGIGDLRFSIKANFLSKGAFNLAVAAPFSIPTNTQLSLGDENVTFSPRAILELDTKYFDAALNVGYMLRAEQDVKFTNQNIAVDDELFGSVGVKVVLWKDKLDLVGDVYASMVVSEQDKEEVPVEALGGLRFHLPYGITTNFGGGAGLTRGAGTPTFRVLWGVSWQPPAPQKPIKETVYIKELCPECPMCAVCLRCPEPKVIVKKDALILPPLFFDFDKDYIRSTSKPVLLYVVKLIKMNPSISKIYVHGHTDSKGSVEYNTDLGRRRALHVMSALKNHGVNTTLQGYTHSELEPYTSNDTADGRAQNRRVELKVVRDSELPSLGDE